MKLEVIRNLKHGMPITDDVQWPLFAFEGDVIMKNFVMSTLNKTEQSSSIAAENLSALENARIVMSIVITCYNGLINIE